MAKWREGFTPTEISKRLNSAKMGSSNGKATFSGFELSELLIILGGMIEITDEIPEHEKAKILTQCVFDVGGKGAFTPAGLLKAINVSEIEYINRPLIQYRVVTGLSISWMVQLSNFRSESAIVTARPKFMRGLKNHKQAFKEARGMLDFELPTQYANVVIAIRARSPMEGVQQALDAIDIKRALWNLSINRAKSWRYSSGPPKPINEILLYPFHTIHSPSGQMASEYWWYEPSHTTKTRLFDDQHKFSRAEKFSQLAKNRLKNIRYRDDICTALIRYVRALDSPDLSESFLRLWGILEYLTDSTNDTYKVTIRRTAFIFAEREYTMQILTYLMNFRNRFVHAGVNTSQIESLVFLLKRHVESLFIFHFNVSFGFKSRAEAAKFMDLPYKRADIDSKLKQLKMARNFISMSL